MESQINSLETRTEKMEEWFNKDLEEIKKSQYIMNNPIKNTLEETNSKIMEAEDRISEAEDQFSRSVVSNSLRPQESQHAKPPCPSPTPGVHSDSRPSSQ